MNIHDRAFSALPILIDVAENPHKVIHGRFPGKITYGDLAQLINYSPRSMGKVCSYIRDEITRPRKLPHLNCIVVTAKTGYPTEIDTGDTPEEAKHKFPMMSQAVYTYDNWRTILKK